MLNVSQWVLIAPPVLLVTTISGLLFRSSESRFNILHSITPPPLTWRAVGVQDGPVASCCLCLAASLASLWHSWHEDLSDQTTSFHSSTVYCFCFLSHCKCLEAVHRGQESYPACPSVVIPPFTLDCTGLCAWKLITISYNCTVMLDVKHWTFDNLLWPEAGSVPHIHLPMPSSLNSKGFEEVHIVWGGDCQSSRHPQTSL